MKKNTVSVAALVTLATLALTACSSGTSSDQGAPASTVTVTQSPAPASVEPPPPSTSPSAQPTSSASANKIIPVEALETLWVPSLCGNDAATLVDGMLPAAAMRNVGSVPGLVRMEDGTPMGAYTDINGDGRDEAAVAYYCDMGGVSWPAHLLVYDNDLNYMTTVDFSDLGGYVQGRGNFISLHWKDHAIQVEMLAGTANDAACCPSRKVTVELTMPGNQPVTRIIDDVPFEERVSTPTGV